MMNLILSGLTLTKKKEKKMKITEFNKMVCEREGKEEELTIAQVAEVVKIVDELTNGVLYGVIELMPTECKKCST
jgi:F0F1-type ATP synthase assembly protein I